MATSARAITPVHCYKLLFSKGTILYQSIKEILRKLYHYNHQKEFWDLSSRPKPVQTANRDSTQSRSIHDWGGPLTRHALQAIYTLALICLLRSDEVLKIRRDHIEFVKNDDNSEYMVLTLPFQKTHQDGRTFSHLFLELRLMLITCNDRCSTFLYLPT